MIRTLAERMVPDVACLVLVTLRPQHLAEMCGDFRIGEVGECTLQQLAGDILVAALVFDPAHAVDDRCVVRVQAQRLADQIVRLVESLGVRSEEHTSELQSLMRISYAVFCLKKKIYKQHCSNSQRLCDSIYTIMPHQ